jgi:TolA-binding protein
MGKSKKKVVDLKPEAISEDQLKELQQVVSAINKLQFDIGTMEVQKHNALHALFQGNDKLNAMQEKLKEQYGTNDINIQDGVINYKEDEPSDS